MLPFALATLLALAATPPAPDARRERVYVGVYLSDVSNLDLRAGRFDVDLFVWAKWAGGDEAPRLEFLNGQLDQASAQVREDDGDWRSARWRIQGTFRGTFPLQAFPFDRQVLPIKVALLDDERELVPDLAGSGMAGGFSITGWLYEPYFRAQQDPLALASDFGSVRREGTATRLESVAFVVDLHRPMAAYVVKFMVPLAIIVAVALLSFFVPQSRFEARASLGVTALLSCVAFHFTQASSLPDVSYLVAADKLFIGAYAVVFVTIAQGLFSYRLFERNPVASARMDRVVQWVAPVATAAAAVVLMWASIPAQKVEAGPQAPAAYHPPAEGPSLRVGVTALGGLNSHGIHALLRRGFTHQDGSGHRLPHLVTVLPEMTNDRVRFLPDGGMTVLWELRPGLRWSDGTPITGRDVLFALELNEDPDRAEVTLLDEATVQVRYLRRVPRALDDLILYPRAQAEPLFKEEGEEGLSQRAREAPLAGDGPYLMERFEPKVEALFRRNPHFAGQRPHFERISIRTYKSSADLAHALLAGELDLAPSISVQGLDLLEATEAVVTRAIPSDFFHFLQPDLKVKPLDDLRVRQAILHAVDRTALAQTLFGRGGAVAHTYRPEAFLDFAAAAPRLPYDPERARALLQQAGLSLPVPLRLIAPFAPEDTPHMRAVRRIASDLGLAGFAVELVLEKKSLLSAWTRGDHGGLLFYFRRNTDQADKMWNLPGAGSLFAQDAAAAWDRHRATLFSERREVLSRRIQLEWARNLPAVPLLFGADQSAWSAQLTGIDPGKGGPLWWNVEAWRLQPPEVPAAR